jgi:hypothetical protein
MRSSSASYRASDTLASFGAAGVLALRAAEFLDAEVLDAEVLDAEVLDADVLAVEVFDAPAGLLFAIRSVQRR